MSACGGGDEPAQSGKDQPADTAKGGEDTGGLNDAGAAVPDASGPDAGGAQDVAVADTAAADAGTDAAGSPDGGADAGAPDTVADCPGGAGCACEANADCDAAICIPVAGGKKCAAKCVDKCPQGFACVTAGAGDVLSICAPVYDWLCNPCTKSDDCQGLAVAQAACLDQGAAGSFCGVPCNSDEVCPTGYACKSATSVEGVTSKQCVRTPDDASDKPGACACSAAAVAQKMSTSCAVESKNDKGEVIAACPGVRSCGPDGLGACVGPPPAAEKCDGVDNDCDGSTDEQTCDDNNPCSTDACDPSKASETQEGCLHIKIAAPCDADGSVCTEGDSCQDGLCLPGKTKVCDDKNACTLDQCDPKKGCTNSPDDGTGCDDDNPCTLADTCAAGVCVAGPAKSCPGSGPCIIGQCDPTSAKCAYKKLDAACNDGNACTHKDACDDGFCTGTAVDCDDANPCTADTCDKVQGCAHGPNNAPCDDGSACTLSDACKGGACVGMPLDVTATCGDANPCTVDACDKVKGCTHTPAVGACSDGNACTIGDLCKDAQCVPGANTCACTQSADCANKEDGDLCNGTLFCNTSKVPYKCEINPATVVACSPLENTACLQNKCAAATGKCAMEAVAEGQGCDADGSLCTQGDVCKSGLCEAGAQVACDDKNACTKDSCDAKKGCVHAPHTGSCEDGDACTVGDQCAQGVCLSGKPQSCDDGNDCTVDSCDKAKGCVQTAQAGKSFPCYTGKPGTSGTGVCKGGEKACQADGSLGPCKGEVVPAAQEACDGKDDDCDGQTDVGCAAVGFRFVQSSALVAGPAGGGQVRAAVGTGGLAGTAASGTYGAKLGAWAWLRSLLAK